MERREGMVYKRGDLVIRPADKQGFMVVNVAPSLSEEDDAQTMIEVTDGKRRFLLPAADIRNQVISSKSQAKR